MKKVDENEKKYHGFIILPRQAKHLRKELGSSLFHFYLDLILEARWHRKDKHTFGRILLNQSELASELSLDQGSISKKLKQLQEKNRYSIIKYKDSLLLGFFPLFLSDVASKMHSKNYANWHEVYADMHQINAEMQEKYEEMHNYRSQNASQRLYHSSNVYPSFNVDSDTEIDVDEIDKGIERMRKEGGG